MIPTFARLEAILARHDAAVAHGATAESWLAIAADLEVFAAALERYAPGDIAVDRTRTIAIACRLSATTSRLQ